MYVSMQTEPRGWMLELDLEQKNSTAHHTTPARSLLLPCTLVHHRATVRQPTLSLFSSVYAILPQTLVRSESSLAAAPQRQHKMQRSAAFETIFRRGFVVGPVSLRQRRSWLDLLGVGGERNETRRTFACRRR